MATLLFPSTRRPLREPREWRRHAGRRAVAVCEGNEFQVDGRMIQQPPSAARQQLVSTLKRSELMISTCRVERQRMASGRGLPAVCRADVSLAFVQKSREYSILRRKQHRGRHVVRID